MVEIMKMPGQKRVEEIKEENLGYCKKAYVKEEGNEKYTFLEGSLTHCLKNQVYLEGGYKIYFKLTQIMSEKIKEKKNAVGYKILKEAYEEMLKILIRNSKLNLQETLGAMERNDFVYEEVPENVTVVSSVLMNSCVSAMNLLLIDEIIKAGKPIREEASAVGITRKMVTNIYNKINQWLEKVNLQFAVEIIFGNGKDKFTKEDEVSLYFFCCLGIRNPYEDLLALPSLQEYLYLVDGNIRYTEVSVNDTSLKPYININPEVSYPHTASRHNKYKFGKGKIPILERFICTLMRRGKNNGKKELATKAVKDAFTIIHTITKSNPLQVLVDALINAGPREDCARVGKGGAMRRTSVDSARKCTKTIAECIADELIPAAKNSPNSFAVKKKDEIERMAKSNR
ncbi:hypothetical protein NQ315_011252 [Exocentrus adspersus]|uniref:Small ribosomal subunit protein uS7 domain-containing protein n=1 Tax=Exocentrus adspersus TaxID=1586481 RepID=A0AAV8V779_9CUCU|nr:hypothetical protein NQ315_011252 [Exocentrus adspersus]